MTHASDFVPLDTRSDDELVTLAIGGMHDAFGVIITRYNQRMYRVARSILRDNAEAEDAVQEAYLSAFSALSAFRGEAGLGTWLTRIIVNEALGRMRRRKPDVPLDAIHAPGAPNEADILLFPGAARPLNPEQAMAVGEIRHILERAVDTLPPNLRLVFVLRDIEGLSVAETASHIQIPEATVKTRLHRARKLMRAGLDKTVETALHDTFPFRGARCERIRTQVLARIAQLPSGQP